jgi:hypothetical protein
MALSTVKIADTIEFCKRLSFDRNPVIGNSLDPALTSANMVMQTVLGPPFSWWWNNEEIVFTCNPTLQVGAITNISIAAGVITVTLTSGTPFPVGSSVVLSAVNVATQVNGQAFVIASSSATQFTANTSLANYTSAANTGAVTATSTQDYSVVVPEFSHIEHSSVYDVNFTPSQWFELEVKNNLSLDTRPDRPRFINPHTEDGNGNMTFRVMPSPDKAYPISIHIQKAAPQLNSINQTWAPIPDYMQYVYNWGFLALMWQFADDPRSQVANQKFLAGLLARAEGIDEEDRNAFLNAWHNLTGLENMKTQQGTQARGV